MADKDNGKGALVIAGGALGIGLATLLQKRPVEAAPDTTKLDYIASLLEQIVANTAILPGGGPSSILTPWIGDKDPVQIYQQVIRSAGPFQSDVMIDMRNVKRLAIRAESSLNTVQTLQLVGNFSNSFNMAVNVGVAAPCPINGQVGFGLAWGDWMPYIGVIITPIGIPVTGLLTIWAVVQE